MDLQYIQELRDERKRLADQANEILTKAKEAQRMDLSTEELGKFNAIHADIDKLKARIECEERQAAEMSILAEPQGRRSEQTLTTTTTSRRVLGAITDRDRTEGLRAWMAAGNPEQ